MQCYRLFVITHLLLLCPMYSQFNKRSGFWFNLHKRRIYRNEVRGMWSNTRQKNCRKKDCFYTIFFYLQTPPRIAISSFSLFIASLLLSILSRYSLFILSRSSLIDSPFILSTYFRKWDWQKLLSIFSDGNEDIKMH